jgi:hypothetical protein
MLGLMNDSGRVISGWFRFKLAWLVALTLVAGTLSARAWVAPIESHAGKALPAQSGRSQPDKPDKSRDGSERTIQIAPQADVWHGVSERPLVERPASGSEQLPLVGICQATRRSLVNGPFVRVEPYPDRRQGERYRLICRYAHAPPVDA